MTIHYVHKSRAALSLAILMLAACGGGGRGGAPPLTYTVGGTVSGLSGSGLVLRDNAVDDLAMASDGSFTFATRFGTGTAYSVGVFTQPTGPSQTCTVKNAAGQVGNGNVTSVTVECTTNTYAVGGSVSGLAGSGLVLQNNGSDDLGVSANGPFVFATAVASGATYSVGLASQPGSPAQICTVMNAIGVVDAADITNVIVGCVVTPASVSVLPANVNVAAGAAQQFTATVTGMSSTAVTWNVNGITGGNSTLGTVSGTGLYVAPTAATTATVTAVALADPSNSASATVTVLAPHRIGVRQTATNAEFYDRTSGNTFRPRGHNYIRLGSETKFDGTNYFGHVIFAVGRYDATRSEAELAAMQMSGYNVVTVITEGCCTGGIGDPAGGLSKAYIVNVVDFLKRARAHDIVVTIANQWLPDYGGYTAALSGCSAQFDTNNIEMLSSCGVVATQAYYTDLMRALIDAGAPLDAIESIELYDEYCYDATSAPLNATSGSVTISNGRTYDLGNAASRQQMMDDGLVYYADQVGAAIRALDPTVLVTISFFPPQGPNPSRIGDPRIIQAYPAVARSTLDYIDLHLYPIAYGLTMAQGVENFGMAGYLQKQPVVMGEFGAFISLYPTIADAAAALKDWQVQSCVYGFQGWLLWTWDTDEQPELWNAQSQGGVINQALSPVMRADPCS